MADLTFSPLFKALTGNEPFPWQEALFERLVANDVPSHCDIPTGLGKTSVVAIWLLALARRVEIGTARGFPRRLVYVVNRRTVVDQATREAESLCKKVDDPRLATCWASLRSLRIQDPRGLEHLGSALAISTLRGQFADNGAWRADPARPAIVIGTVDMIGSRLLFSGYGRGFKTRPLHAGLLGQGALLVHDEAHLEPAFQELLLAIEREHGRDDRSIRDGFGRILVMALTATSRSEASSASRGKFHLTEADLEHATVLERIRARKRIEFHPVDEKKVKVLDRVAELALAHRDSGGAIVVFLRKVDDVQRLKKRLPVGSFTLLTGTIRGLERDRLKCDPIFARFDPKPSVAPDAVRRGTVYLVCTSAGEVGVDLSADHLVCDLTPFDSMAQRFGRVNRFGVGDACIDIVHANDTADTDKDELEPFERARARTLELLARLPRSDGGYDASPAALAALPADERQAAFTPEPEILPVTRVLFDAWAHTSIVDDLPGRPPVADWLHGVAEWEPPETHVAWRDEVEAGRVPSSFAPRLLEVYPLKPHELLRDTTKRIFKELVEIAERAPDSPVWVIDPEGRVITETLGDVKAKGDANLAHATVILPPSVGGLDETGALDGREPARNGADVADEWRDEHGKRRRVRLVVGAEGETREQEGEHKGMRLVLSIPQTAEADAADDAVGDPATWRWYVEPTSADNQGSRSAAKPQTLPFHLASAEHFAREIVGALGLDEPEAEAVIWAARFHDLGKERRLWQRSIGNFDLGRTLAKSDGKRVGGNMTKYRHELGSLFDIEREPEFARLDDGQKDLARHIVAAHHGRARPCFLRGEVFDPSHSEAECIVIAREVPRRFARLQRKYGRWGLAYLESLLRAADVLASLASESESVGAPTRERAAE